MFGLARGLLPYRREWLVKDIVAGIVLSTLLVPQGMAYAELAGLPPITGLYTSILCLLGYAVLGPSKILVLGPDSSLGPMIAATILPLAGADGDPARAIALASMLALITGGLLVLGAVARLGFIADLISKPTMIGYMNGLALTILVGQLPKLFGFKVDADGFIGELTGFVKGLAHGDAVAAEDPGRADHGRARDRRHDGVQPGRPRGQPGGRAAQGVPAADHPGRPRVRPRAAGRRGAGDRPGVAGRHDLDRVRVRRPYRAGDRRQRRDDRDRRGEPGRGPVPGVPGQHQRVADGGSRTVRRQKPAHRRHRGRGDHRDDRARARVVP